MGKFSCPQRPTNKVNAMYLTFLDQKILWTDTQLMRKVSGQGYVEETLASRKPCVHSVQLDAMEESSSVIVSCFCRDDLYSITWLVYRQQRPCWYENLQPSSFFCSLRLCHLSTFRRSSHNRWSFRFNCTPHSVIDRRIFTSGFNRNIARQPPSGGSVHRWRARSPGPVVYSFRLIHCWLYSSVLHPVGPTSSLSAFGYLFWENRQIYYQHGRTERLRHQK